MSTSLSYRIAEEQDIPKLVRLWVENTDWGPLTTEDYRLKYAASTYGPCITPVAVDSEGEIVGQMKFFPSRVIVDGRLYEALCMHAMILCRSSRSSWALNEEHPLVRLCRSGIEAAIAKGYRIVYGLPVHPWHLLFRRLGNFSWTVYPSRTLSLAEACRSRHPQSAAVHTSLATDFGAEYIRLWESAVCSHPIFCGVYREPRLLRQKLDEGILVVSVRDRSSGSLVGYCMVKRKKGLIVDLLARTPNEVSLVLHASVRYLATRSGSGAVPLVKYFRAIQTPLLEPALDAIGFSPHGYKFAFVCTSLDPSLPLERVSATRWYIMPGD